LAIGIRTAVVFLGSTFVFVDAFTLTPVVVVTSVFAKTFTIPANGSGGTCSWACFSLTTSVAITNVRRTAHTFLHRVARVSGHVFAVGVVVTFGADITRGAFRFAIANETIAADARVTRAIVTSDGRYAICKGVTIVVLTDGLLHTCITITLVAGRTDADAGLMSIRTLLGFAFRIVIAYDSSAWVDVNFTHVSISTVSVFAGTLVVVFTVDNAVGDTISVDITVMVFARINGGTNLAITIKAKFTLACMVDFVSNDC